MPQTNKSEIENKDHVSVFEIVFVLKTNYIKILLFLFLGLFFILGYYFYYLKSTYSFTSNINLLNNDLGAKSSLSLVYPEYSSQISTFFSGINDLDYLLRLQPSPSKQETLIEFKNPVEQLLSNVGKVQKNFFNSSEILVEDPEYYFYFKKDINDESDNNIKNFYILESANPSLERGMEIQQLFIIYIKDSVNLIIKNQLFSYPEILSKYLSQKLNIIKGTIISEIINYEEKDSKILDKNLKVLKNSETYKKINNFVIGIEDMDSKKSFLNFLENIDKKIIYMLSDTTLKQIIKFDYLFKDLLQIDSLISAHDQTYSYYDDFLRADINDIGTNNLKSSKIKFILFSYFFYSLFIIFIYPFIIFYTRWEKEKN